MISPVRYRSHIPSHLDVIFLLPFPSVNTLQVSHIRRECIGATMVAAANDGEEISKRRKQQSYARAISMPRPSLESRICLPSYFGPLDHIRRICLLERREGSPRASFETENLWASRAALTRKGTPERWNDAMPREVIEISRQTDVQNSEEFILQYKCIMTLGFIYLSSV